MSRSILILCASLLGLTLLTACADLAPRTPHGWSGHVAPHIDGVFP